MSVLLLSSLYTWEILWRQLRIFRKWSQSCMKCGFPHQRSNYDKVISRFQEIIAVMAASDKGDMPHEM